MNKNFHDATIFYRFFDKKTDVVNVFWEKQQRYKGLDDFHIFKHGHITLPTFGRQEDKPHRSLIWREGVNHHGRCLQKPCKQDCAC